MEQEERSSFWSTLPGILTGSAALITAATGGYIAFNKSADSAAAASHPETRASTQANLAGESAPTTSDDEGEPANGSGPRRSLVGVTARPSFNCALAATDVEHMLCEDVDLAAKDRRVAAEYFALKRTL